MELRSIGKVAATDALLDSGITNQTVWGTFKPVIKRYVLTSVAGYLQKQGAAAQTFAHALVSERHLGDAMAGRWSAQYVDALATDLPSATARYRYGHRPNRGPGLDPVLCLWI